MIASKAVYRAADVSDGGICDKVAKILTGTDEEAASILACLTVGVLDRYKVDCSRMAARNASLEAGVKKVDIE
ncbi:hypothetical protein T06_9904 [Trichinella sp. T6]|nr:hypothetical protein T06_9904 [Trichinella sp. T6]